MSLEDHPDAVEAAVFGREVEVFLESRLGKYLLEYAQDRSYEAMQALKRVSPWRRRKIVELQNTITCWEGFAERIAQAINDGEHATRWLEEINGEA